MGDLISIEAGLEPWRPAPDAELEETLHFFDMPLEGVVRQAGNRFAFWCVDGHGGPESLWAYSLIDVDDVAPLRVADRPESVLFAKMSPMPVVVAVAREGAGQDGGTGIVTSALVGNPLAYESLVAAAIEAFRMAGQDVAALGHLAS
jgi:hypothetical protein